MDDVRCFQSLRQRFCCEPKAYFTAITNILPLKKEELDKHLRQYSEITYRFDNYCTLYDVDAVCAYFFHSKGNSAVHVKQVFAQINQAIIDKQNRKVQIKQQKRQVMMSKLDRRKTLLAKSLGLVGIKLDIGLPICNNFVRSLYNQLPIYRIVQLMQKQQRYFCEYIEWDYIHLIRERIDRSNSEKKIQDTCLHVPIWIRRLHPDIQKLYLDDKDFVCYVKYDFKHTRNAAYEKLYNCSYDEDDDEGFISPGWVCTNNLIEDILGVQYKIETHIWPWMQNVTVEQWRKSDPYIRFLHMIDESYT
jgi:hypothetical protein